jgi:hypothetical protein
MPGGQLPTKMELLFSGFQSSRVIINSLAIGIVLIIVAKELNTFKNYKKGIWQIMYTSFSWMILFATLYLISEFIWYRTGANFSTSFSLVIIRKQLPFLMVLYFILIIPIVAILYKKNSKALPAR